jgi:diacylglycerol kinase (ATP)
LGLLPLGTAKDFARTLMIPTDLERACETGTQGKVVDVDLGLTGEDYYVNVASVGLGAEVTQALSSQMKRAAGALGYPLAAIKAFFSHKPFSTTLTFPGDDHHPVTFERLLQVAVANGRFYGVELTADARIDDCPLDVYAIEMGCPRDLIGLARYLKRGAETETRLPMEVRRADHKPRRLPDRPEYGCLAIPDCNGGPATPKRGRGASPP